MTTGNEELMHECFQKHLRLEQQEINKTDKEKKIGRDA